MKRDMSLVREILLATEAHPPGQGPADIQVPGFSAEQVSYHVKIMAEAGLIEALDASTRRVGNMNHLRRRWPVLGPPQPDITSQTRTLAAPGARCHSNPYRQPRDVHGAPLDGE